MIEVEVTWNKVAKIWWSLLWRSILFGLIAGFLIGFIIGFVGAIAHIDKSIIETLCFVAGLLTVIPVGLWVIKKVLQKKYKDFRIALVQNLS